MFIFIHDILLGFWLIIESLFQFMSELARVAAPGATIILVTWCHRDLLPSEESLQPYESNLLKKICNAFYLPEWCSAADYIKIAQSLGLEVHSILFNLNILVIVKNPEKGRCNCVKGNRVSCDLV